MRLNTYMYMYMYEHDFTSLRRGVRLDGRRNFCAFPHEGPSRHPFHCLSVECPISGAVILALICLQIARELLVRRPRFKGVYNHRQRCSQLRSYEQFLGARVVRWRRRTSELHSTRICALNALLRSSIEHMAWLILKNRAGFLPFFIQHLPQLILRLV